VPQTVNLRCMSLRPPCDLLRPADEVLREVSRQPVQRLDENLGIADLGKRPAGVAEAGILFTVALLADHWSDKAKHCKDLLETLASLVHGLVPRPRVRPGKMLQGFVHLLPHDPPNALAERLGGLQFEGHGRPSCASGADRTGGPRPAPSFLASASRTPGTVATRAGTLGYCFQQFLGVDGTPPGERLELPPFQLVVGDEEVLDLVQPLPAHFL
jgi:hypothetical protein